MNPFPVSYCIGLQRTRDLLDGIAEWREATGDARARARRWVKPLLERDRLERWKAWDAIRSKSR